MFLECFFAVVVPAYPVAYGVVVLVVTFGFLFAAVYSIHEVACPFAVAESFLVVSDHRDITKAGPALEFAVRNAVVVGYFEFLDAIVVPLVSLEDCPVRIDPDGGLFDAVCMPCEDLFFGPLDCTADGIA